MKKSVFTFGETMGLVRSTELGGLETATDAKIGIGGADSNVAIGLRRLGIDVHWTGRVGDDALGRRVVRELSGEGVKVHSVIDTDAPTGLMLKEKRTAHSTRVYFYRRGSAGSRIGPADLDADLITSAAVLHVTGITASLSASAERAVFFAIETARNAGVPVAFDVNHRASLWASGDPGHLYRRIAEKADILFAGDDEARLMIPGASSSLEALAQSLAALGPAEVIVKLGARGSIGLIDERTFSQPAIPVNVVDSVGAGDAFVAGYLSGRITGVGASERLDLATTAGAFACLGPGDWESLPRVEDLTLLQAVEPVHR